MLSNLPCEHQSIGRGRFKGDEIPKFDTKGWYATSTLGNESSASVLSPMKSR